MGTQTSASSQKRDWSTNKTNEEHRIAIVVYALIFVAFLTLISTAVITTMNMEKNKTGFRAIEVEEPISFFDKTYMKDGQGQGQSQSTEAPQTPVSPPNTGITTEP